MGLTNQSTGLGVINHVIGRESFNHERVVALAGNPNVGKSTVFNSLTGLNQHTGNWPGKTVANAQGRYEYKGQSFILVDIPGTYSLMSNSMEEEVARDFVCFGKPDTTVIVTDATCLERNLNLVLQVLEITPKVVVCVNLIDEAARKKISINLSRLKTALGVPVIGTNARNSVGLNDLMKAVDDVAQNRNMTVPLRVTYDPVIEESIRRIEPNVKKVVGDEINSRWVSIKLLDGEITIIRSLEKFLGIKLDEDQELAESLVRTKKYLSDQGIHEEKFRDLIVSSLVQKAEEICQNGVVQFEKPKVNQFDRRMDRILLSKILGIPIMIGLLALIFWLTIVGANYPSQVISSLLFGVEEKLTVFFAMVHAPGWLHDALVLGVYRTLAWVVSVMLPPMAIFFPLFTLLEDSGYLPRIAFNLDGFFQRACAHGKQALTMCMGFGCNAAGIIGCRIIDSPRERLIAILTNNFVPCNGRFPTLIAISSIFIGGLVAEPYRSLVSTLAMVGVILLGVVMTLTISRLISKTILKGVPSSFTLELPPYRKPQLGRILVRSLMDRTLFVLGRAVCVAAPAGLFIWCMANIQLGGSSILNQFAQFLQPFAALIGLDGYILMAFILGLPANEIVIPIMIMSYLSTGSMLELSSLTELRALLIDHGWTWLTGVCVMLFSLMHYPCGTTLWTIKKETKSWKWTLLAFMIPTVTGILICFIVAQAARLLFF
ncbi:ferrous iron transport protein B [Dehalobacterium formicoaceticum]|uniref:ferrous iron transport protein B n=1 Tax=Dehalobacterium formicoaceticum TaxID=51515 RepID=UPI000B7D39BD|nr:ferrous iron transport protein B [Dehalobacterium formicoaceticum]